MKVIFNYATRQFEPMEPSMRERFALGGGVIQGEKVGGRENFADISLGGQKTSALQEKVTSAARNNLDSFVKEWILNNTGDYNATEIDKWKNDLEIAVTEEIGKILEEAQKKPEDFFPDDTAEIIKFPDDPEEGFAKGGIVSLT